MRQIKHLPVLLIIGIFIGILLSLSPATILIISIFLCSVFCIKRFIKTESTNFLIVIFTIGFLLRALLAVLNYHVGLMPPFRGGDTQPDAVIYNGNAFYIAHALRGGLDHERYYMDENPFLEHSIEKGYRSFKGKLPRLRPYQYGNYVFFLGFFYSIFGYAPIAAKMLNGLAGCLAAILTYVFAKTLIGSETPAKVSAALTMFFPSLLYWSVTSLQDTTVNCLFLLYLLSAVIYLKGSKKIHLFVLFISSIMLSSLKTKMAILLWAGAALFLAIKLLRIIIGKKLFLKSILLYAITVVVLLVMIIQYPAITDFFKRNIELMTSLHKSAAEDYPSASGFKIYMDNFYGKGKVELANFFNIGILFIMFRALSYYFLLPFLWDIPYSHPFLLLFYPQMIFILLCLPFMVIGILSSLRYNPVITLSVIMLLTLISLPQAMAEGIMGNVVRHRDMFMPFILVFSTYGFYVSVMQSDKNRNLTE